MACMDWDDYLPHEAANPAMPPQDRGRLNSRARPSRLGHSRVINTSGARSLPRSRRTWKSSPQGDVELMTEKEVLDFKRPILKRHDADRRDKFHGFGLRDANPFHGGWSSPTMGAQSVLSGDC